MSPEQIKTALNKKVGPWPIWIWIVATILGVAIGLALRSRLGSGGGGGGVQADGNALEPLPALEPWELSGFAAAGNAVFPAASDGSGGGGGGQGGSNGGDGSGGSGGSPGGSPGGSAGADQRGGVTIGQIREVIAIDGRDRPAGGRTYVPTTTVKTADPIPMPYRAPSKTATTYEPTPTRVASASRVTYTVKSGDYLSKIALKYPGVSWQDIYNANRSVIGSNPDLIKPGQVLVIPAAA